jgi:formylglycine-generating enzyme required for sulfatase activity
MHGNVADWCLDRGPDGSGELNWTDKDSKIDPKGPTVGSGRICRGGCCSDEARLCRSSSRARYDASHRLMGTGFRVVCPAGDSR